MQALANEKDSLDEVFYRSSPLASGLQRTGVSAERILEQPAGRPLAVGTADDDCAQLLLRGSGAAACACTRGTTM